MGTPTNESQKVIQSRGCQHSSTTISNAQSPAIPVYRLAHPTFMCCFPCVAGLLSLSTVFAPYGLPLAGSLD
jgi:ubiquitin C-terminal hydrolase